MDAEKKALLKRYKASKKSRFRKWSRQEKIVLTATTVIFSVYALTLVYPFVFTFINALKTPMDFSTDPLSLPAKAQWSNFLTALKINYNGVTLLDMLWNRRCLPPFAA